MRTRKAFQTLRGAAQLGYRVIGKDVILPALERYVTGRHAPDPEGVRPVFILGAPRTGSTLLYELLVTVYQAAFFSNLAAFFFRSPALITRLVGYLGLRHRFSSRSTYGYVAGLCAPSEAKAVHDAWFGDPAGNREPEVDPAVPRRTVRDMTACQGGPFVSKNLNNNLRLVQIAQVYPEAVFIHIKRAPIYTAQSILLARRRLLGDDAGWFSVQPPGYERIRHLPPYEQVVWQIRTIEEGIDNASARGVVKHVIETRYDDLTANWEKELGRIVAQCEKYGVFFERSGFPGAIHLESRDKRSLTEPEWRDLGRVVKKDYRASESS
jgi:hypothetical protein